MIFFSYDIFNDCGCFLDYYLRIREYYVFIYDNVFKFVKLYPALKQNDFTTFNGVLFYFFFLNILFYCLIELNIHYFIIPF
jgi:hypothetical protein